MFAQWIITLLILLGVAYCCYKLVTGYYTKPCECTPEEMRLKELQRKLRIAKSKVIVLASTEGVGEELAELEEEIRQHEIELAEILEGVEND